ncbi:hypothetical protein ACFL0W_04340 [Nanoarchaeota archaeon]
MTEQPGQTTEATGIAGVVTNRDSKRLARIPEDPAANSAAYDLIGELAAQMGYRADEIEKIYDYKTSVEAGKVTEPTTEDEAMFDRIIGVSKSYATAVHEYGLNHEAAMNRHVIGKYYGDENYKSVVNSMMALGESLNQKTMAMARFGEAETRVERPNYLN